MKFFVAVATFVLAVAMGVQSSVIPLNYISEIAGHGLAYTAVSSPAASIAVHSHAAAWPAEHAWAAHDHAWPAEHAWPAAAHWAAPAAAHWAAPAAVIAAAHPAPAAALVVASAAHAHAHPAAAIVVAPAHEGSYVAKTRGALHTAPLAGHANSVTSVNVAPAPGTI